MDGPMHGMAPYEVFEAQQPIPVDDAQVNSRLMQSHW